MPRRVLIRGGGVACWGGGKMELRCVRGRRDVLEVFDVFCGDWRELFEVATFAVRHFER